MLETTRPADYSAVVAGLRIDEPSALAELNHIFRRGVQFLLSRSGVSDSNLGTLADECFERVQAQIKRGVLLDPAELSKLVQTSLKTMMPRSVPVTVSVTERERTARALNQMSSRGRRAIKAYFVDRESRATICTRLRISESAFEQYKREAKLLCRKSLEEQTSWDRNVKLG